MRWKTGPARRSRPSSRKAAPPRRFAPMCQRLPTARRWCRLRSSAMAGSTSSTTTSGISVRADVLDVTEEQWDRVMAINVRSIMLTGKYAIPHMIRGGGGSIINISSIAGLRANQSTPYSTSKAAVIGITRSMAGDHGRQGIRVNCIVPGLVYGPMVAPRMDAALRQRRREAAPLGTEGTGWDVAWAAVFLASDESRWITGVALPVDAGLLVMSPVTNARLAQQKF